MDWEKANHLRELKEKKNSFLPQFGTTAIGLMNPLLLSPLLCLGAKYATFSIFISIF